MRALGGMGRDMQVALCTLGLKDRQQGMKEKTHARGVGAQPYAAHGNDERRFRFIVVAEI